MANTNNFIEECNNQLTLLNNKKNIMVEQLNDYINPFTTPTQIDVNEFSAKLTSINIDIENVNKLIMEHRDKIVLLEKNNDKLERENSALRADQSTHSGELWLTDVIDIENPIWGLVNLILAPVGCGKTTLIKQRLAKEVKGTVLMLVSTSNLRDVIAPNDNKTREKNSDRAITTRNTKAFGEGECDILTMTYAQFGLKLYTEGRAFLEDIDFIFCDEIHSLPEYESFGKNRGLTLAVDYLFRNHDKKEIFMFTATDENLIIMNRDNPTIMDKVKIFDYREYPNIRKYTSLFTMEFSDLEQIRELLRSSDCQGDFVNYGHKGLIFSNTISSMKIIEDIVTEEGFKPLVLWSKNNIDNPLNDEQLRCLAEINITNKIPDGYNFLIINDAMREGWDLFDKKVQLVIINSTSETSQVQARGRARHNIALQYNKVSREDYKIKIDNIIVPDKYLNVNLTKEDKDRLCAELNILDSKGRLYKWRKINEIIIDSGYLSKPKRITVDGKKISVSVITKK